MFYREIEIIHTLKIDRSHEIPPRDEIRARIGEAGTILSATGSLPIKISLLMLKLPIRITNLPQIDGSFRAKWADEAAGSSGLVNQSLFSTA